MDERVDVEPGAIVLGYLAELRGIKPDAWTEGTLFDLAMRLDRVSAAEALLHEIRGWLETVLAESMDADEVPVPGIGVARRTEAKRSTWRYPEAGEQMREDLSVAVAKEVSLDVATGEMDPMKRNVALHALRVAYEAIPSFSSLKVAGQRRLRLKLGDYRSFETYYTVKIEGAE